MIRLKRHSLIIGLCLIALSSCLLAASAQAGIGAKQMIFSSTAYENANHATVISAVASRKVDALSVRFKGKTYQMRMTGAMFHNRIIWAWRGHMPHALSNLMPLPAPPEPLSAVVLPTRCHRYALIAFSDGHRYTRNFCSAYIS